MTNEIKGGDAHELSTDINVITAEINAYQRVAGEAIFEIGKRLKHVKENDLAHGEWTKWLSTIEVTQDLARRYVRVFEEFGEAKHVTSRVIGLNALYEIAQMPEESRTESHTIPSTGEEKTVDEMTVRELREVKRELKKTQEERDAERKEREQAEKEKLQAEQQAEQARRSEELAIQKLEEFEDGEPEVEIRTKYVEKESEEFRNRSFDTPYGVKLIDDFYNAMDELSEWQKKFAWISADIEQLKRFAEVDEDMKKEFEKNANFWNELESIFNGEDDGVIEAQYTEIL